MTNADDITLTREQIEHIIDLRMGKNEERLGKAISKVEEKLDNFKKYDLKDMMTSMFENSEWMGKFEKSLIRFIEQEVKSQVKNFDVHHAVAQIVKDKINILLKESLVAFVTQIMTSLNHNLNRELMITKRLCYSIDAEIRHTLTDAPLSYQSEKMIKDKIESTLKTMLLNHGVTKSKKGKPSLLEKDSHL